MPASDLASLLSTRALGRTIHALDEVGSTSDLARSLADAGATHGTLVVAEAQRWGRGRRGRVWVSPPGENLLFSLVLRPAIPLARASELTLVAAVAIAEALGGAGFPAAIRWPNDLLLAGKKVAGILTELAASGEAIRWVVLGVGIDVNSRVFPPGVAEIATSLALFSGRDVPRAPLLAAVLGSLESWLARHAREGLGPVRERWLQRSSTIGARVRAEGPEGPVEGLAEAMDEDGALLVRDAAGRLARIVAGDVEPIR